MRSAAFAPPPRFLAAPPGRPPFGSEWHTNPRRGQVVLGGPGRLATPSDSHLTTPAGVASLRTTRDTEGKDATDDPSTIIEQSAQTLTPTVRGPTCPLGNDESSRKRRNGAPDAPPRG